MRDTKLDFFKGLLIWSVILGHCLNVFCPKENFLHVVLRTFDLPMFMYISGFLLKGSIARHEWKQLLLNKFTHIIIPALVWMCISLLFGDHCMYYFLWAVFISSLIVCVCEKVSTKPWINVGIMVLLAVFFHIIPKNIINISFLFPFFLFGYCSKNIAGVGWKKGVSALALFIFLCVFVWQPQFTIWKSGGYILQNTGYMIKVVLLRLVIGMGGIYAVIFVMGKVYDLYGKKIIMSLFSNIGKETLSLYLLQHIVVELGLLWLIHQMKIQHLLTNYHVLFGYVIAPLVSLILLLIMYQIVSLMQKYNYTKWMFGFKINLNKKR